MTISSGTHCRSSHPNPTTPLSLKSARFAHELDATSLHTAHQPHPTHQSPISCEKISHQSSAIPSKPPHRFGQFYCRRAAYLLPNYAYQRKVPATSVESSKHTAPSAPKFASPAPTPTTAPARPLILLRLEIRGPPGTRGPDFFRLGSQGVHQGAQSL